MSNITRADRARFTGAVLYPEVEDARLTLRQVADMTNRHIRVIRHFVKKGVLPADKNDRGAYLVKASHVAIVLWQPAWGVARPLNPNDRRLRRATVPSSTPEEGGLRAEKTDQPIVPII